MSAAGTPGSAPKSMSSRLLTMKFMQRAAKSPTVNSPEEPSLKRKRSETDTTPSKRTVDTMADRAAVLAALASEEARRQTAVDTLAADSGDSRWVLNFEDQKHCAPRSLSLRIVQTGFAALDASPTHWHPEEDEPDDRMATVGRRSYGKFNKVLEKKLNPTHADSAESDHSSRKMEDSDEELDNGYDPTTELIKKSKKEADNRLNVERKARKRVAITGSEQRKKGRRDDDSFLNNLTSLSGKASLAPKIICFRCGGLHKRIDCPNKRGHQGEDDGPPKKSQRHH